MQKSNMFIYMIDLIKRLIRLPFSNAVQKIDKSESMMTLWWPTKYMVDYQ